MGGCHCSEVESSSISTAIEDCIDQNKAFIQSLIYVSLQRQQLGLCVKLLNIQRLMKDYYTRVSCERSAVERAEHRLSEAGKQLFSKSLDEELGQLTTSCQVLKAKYRQMRELTFFEKPEVFLKTCEEDSGLQHTLRQVFRVFRRFKKDLDEAVKNYTNGNGLTSQEKTLILEISQATTHLFSNWRTAIKYQRPAATMRTGSMSPARIRSRKSLRATFHSSNFGECLSPCRNAS